MEILNYFYDGWLDLIDNKSDQRVGDWFLMSSPLPTAAICIAYAYFVKVVGPKLMENRKPFELRRVLIVYNFLQVVFSSWLFYEAGMAGWFNGYSYRCQAIDSSRSPQAMRIAGICWAYYISKFTEFFDTFFFIMRKRYDQVSTLHVIHHGIMPFSVWWGVKFLPGGHLSLFGFINSGVHVIMYTYYMLAAIGPEMQKYLSWKKYLTVLQMVQFTVVFLHAFQLLISNPCQYPTTMVWILGGHAILFFLLFKSFYNRAYTKEKKNSEATRAAKKLDGDACNSKAEILKSPEIVSKACKATIQRTQDYFLAPNQPFVCQSVNAYDYEPLATASKLTYDDMT